MNPTKWEPFDYNEIEIRDCKTNEVMENLSALKPGLPVLCPERLLFDMRNETWLVETIRASGLLFRANRPNTRPHLTNYKSKKGLQKGSHPHRTKFHFRIGLSSKLRHTFHRQQVPTTVISFVLVTIKTIGSVASRRSVCFHQWCTIISMAGSWWRRRSVGNTGPISQKQSRCTQINSSIVQEVGICSRYYCDRKATIIWRCFEGIEVFKTP